jgi:hypothetical protein
LTQHFSERTDEDEVVKEQMTTAMRKESSHMELPIGRASGLVVTGDIDEAAHMYINSARAPRSVAALEAEKLRWSRGLATKKIQY